MKVSKSYKLSEFLVWTRRKVYVVLALAIVPVAVYQLFGQKWISLPWSLAVLLGTATSFIVGFKDAQACSRTVEAQQVWSTIASASRALGNSQPGLSGKPEEHEDARQAAPSLADGHCATSCVSPGSEERYQQGEHGISREVLLSSGDRKPAGSRVGPVPARG